MDGLASDDSKMNLILTPQLPLPLDNQMSGAYAPNTERAVKSDTAIYWEWVSCHRLDGYEADTIAKFVTAMGETRKVATVKRYITSLRMFFRTRGGDNPAKADVVIWALRRLARQYSTRQKQANGITSEMFSRMIDAAGDRVADLRNRALLMVARDTMCRASELVAMNASDVSIAHDGSGTILVRRSKTDQEGQGDVRFIAPDTVDAIAAWVEAADLTDGQALFQRLRKDAARLGRLHRQSVTRIYQRMAKVAGIKIHVSAHSTRVGAAQDMMARGIGMADIMQSGGWKTPRMVAHYTANQAAARSGAAKLAKLENRY